MYTTEYWNKTRDDGTPPDQTWLRIYSTITRDDGRKYGYEYEFVLLVDHVLLCCFASNNFSFPSNIKTLGTKEKAIPAQFCCFPVPPRGPGSATSVRHAVEIGHKKTPGGYNRVLDTRRDGDTPPSPTDCSDFP